MKNFSLNQKISMIIAVMALGLFLVASLGLFKMSQINNSIVEISGVFFEREQQISKMTDTRRVFNLASKDVMIETDKLKKMKYQQAFKAAKVEMLEEMDKFEIISSPEVLVFFSKYKESINTFLVPLIEKIVVASLNNDADALALLRAEEAVTIEKSKTAMRELKEYSKKSLEDKVAKAASDYEAARQYMVVVGLLSLIAGSSVAFYVMRKVSRTINQIIASLNENSNQVTRAAKQIASSSEQLSQATTEQAASLEETSSSIEEMSSMVQKNTEAAKNSAEVATSSQASATRGKEVMNEMILAIEGINNSNQQIAEIVKVIAEIGNKTKVINDIVFQTKLLSFNASVEAARAGEHGKGFAVVAEEVGKLAQMSGNAAKEISTLLDGSIQKVEGIVSETKIKVENGTQIAKRCGEVLEDIVQSVSSVNSMMGDIANASHEQSQGVQEITKAMSQLDQVTQENAATSEEAASAAEKLAAQSESLRNVIRMLADTIKGSSEYSKDSTESHSIEPVVVPARTNVKVKVEPSTGGKLIHLKTEKKNLTGRSPAPAKKVVGLDHVPSENDPRFTDV